MNFITEEKQGHTVVKIEGALTVYEAAGLREQFLTCLNKSNALILNLDEVSDCDTCGIQLLCSAQTTARNMKKSFILTGAPASVRETADSIGLHFEELFHFIEKV